MSNSQATATGGARGKGAVSRLLAFAGPRRALTYLGCALSAVSMLVGFGPYVCVWLVARDLIAVAPDWSAAVGIAGIRLVGVRPLGGEHPAVLRRPHVHAPCGIPLRVQHAQGDH